MPRSSVSLPELLVYLWVDSSSFKVYKAFSDSQSTGHMATLTDFLKRTLVSSFPVMWIAFDTYTTLPLGFNQIDLPQYSSYEMLRQQILLAIHEGGEGFGFA